jgi:hypothetical protein
MTRDTAAPQPLNIYVTFEEQAHRLKCLSTTKRFRGKHSLILKRYGFHMKFVRLLLLLLLLLQTGLNIYVPCFMGRCCDMCAGLPTLRPSGGTIWHVRFPPRHRAAHASCIEQGVCTDMPMPGSAGYWSWWCHA